MYLLFLGIVQNYKMKLDNALIHVCKLRLEEGTEKMKRWSDSVRFLQALLTESVPPKRDRWPPEFSAKGDN